MRAFLTTVTALSVLLSASIAAACPVCASREEGGTLSWFALGAFVISPWFVALYIGIWIRRNTLSPQPVMTDTEIDS